MGDNGSPSRSDLDPWSDVVRDSTEEDQANASWGELNETQTPDWDAWPRRNSKMAIERRRRIELYKIHSINFEMSEGDTLVFIDLPNSPSSGWRLADCNNIAYHAAQFRMHSDRLRSTGSSKFDEMLSPSYQFRILRRRKLVNQLPPAIKYVLDLSPPSEGDDLVFQMTELSLPPGIIKWWRAELLHHVDAGLVSGHDDLCACAQEPTVAQEEESFRLRLPLPPDVILHKKANGENELFPAPAYRNIPDYCPIRHHNAIIRLLMFIEKKDLTLDSASRVWTLVKLAAILDCASTLRDKVARWLMHGWNTRFIEVLPEEALQIGFALKMPTVVQSAFRILVNEMALKEAAAQCMQKYYTRLTVFGRRVGHLPDELSNLVQHGARAFVERISETADWLGNPNLLETLKVEEWNKLCRMQRLLTEDRSDHREAAQQIETLKECLLAQLKGAMDATVNKKSEGENYPCVTMDQDRVLYVEPRDFDTTTYTVQRFNITQKLLCPFIYDDIKNKLGGFTFSKQLTDTNKCPEAVFAATQAFQQAIYNHPGVQHMDEWSAYFDQDSSEMIGTACRVGWPIISLDKLDEQVMQAMAPFTESCNRNDIEPPLNMTRHMLLTLTNNEMKFLPLWAGGCDDGTGGVFESFVPPTDMGPAGPGPSYHTGMTVPSAPGSISSSLMDDMETMRVRGSTTAGSVDVHDSVSTVYRPDQVIVEDVSMPSESFTLGTSEYSAVRLEVPAGQQATEQTVADADDVDVDVDVGYMTPMGGDGDSDWDFASDDSDTTIL